MLRACVVVGQFISFDNVANIYRPSGEARLPMAAQIASGVGVQCKEVKHGSYDIYIFGINFF